VSRRRLVLYLAMIGAAACADANAPGTTQQRATLRVINALASKSTLDVMVSNTTVQEGVPFGSTVDVVIPSSTLPVSVGVRAAGVSRYVRLDKITDAERVLLVAHGADVALEALPGDTNSIRFGVVNVRLALVAPDAPLVKAFIQPATQSALSLPWVITQSPYIAPLFTTYYRGTPSATKLAVYFVAYNPGGQETVLAVSPPFDAYASSAWIVTLDKTTSGYEAVVCHEPTPIIEG
jgi:hypothetical protein